MSNTINSAQDFTNTRLGYLEDRVHSLETRNKTLTNSLTQAWNLLAWTQITLGGSVVALGAGFLAVALR